MHPSSQKSSGLLILHEVAGLPGPKLHELYAMVSSAIYMDLKMLALDEYSL